MPAIKVEREEYRSKILKELRRIMPILEGYSWVWLKSDGEK